MPARRHPRVFASLARIAGLGGQLDAASASELPAGADGGGMTAATR